MAEGQRRAREETGWKPVPLEEEEQSEDQSMTNAYITSWQTAGPTLGDGTAPRTVTLMLGAGIVAMIETPSSFTLSGLMARDIRCDRVVGVHLSNLRAGMAGTPAVGDRLTCKSRNGTGFVEHGFRVTGIEGGTIVGHGLGDRLRLYCVSDQQAIIDRELATAQAGGDV